METWTHEVFTRPWVTALVGFVLGSAGFWLVSSHTSSDLSVETGVVDSVTDDSVCFKAAKGMLDCFAAPGAGLQPGSKVRYAQMSLPIDRDSPDSGATSPTLVWVKAVR